MTEQTAKIETSTTPKIEYYDFGLVKEYLCPSCGEKLKLDHTDDIGTKFFKCEKCGQQTSTPKTEERKQFEEALESEEAALEVDGLYIIPFLDNPMKDLHPAIGEIDNVAYVGVWIPCLIKDKTGGVESKDLLFLIESNRKKMLADNSELQKRSQRLAYHPIHFANRWTLKDVKKFLNGNDVNVSETFNQVLNFYKEFIEFPDNHLYYYHAL